MMSTNGAAGSKCMDVIYDTLTILISIADISTDVIVLISFYVEGRTTFFIISLIILIIAQMAYSVLFIMRYNIFQSPFITISTFFILLPFSSIVSFLVYFTEDKTSWISTQMDKISIIDVSHSFGTHYLRANQSKMTQWIIRKGSKHIGFIIEAGIEALPQSLLQIIAIVHYKEAHYVSIVSIFLSMFSVMTKSLIFSRGFDIKTYMWTWFCIVTDFFGIFFTLTWVFYTDEAFLQPQFWNHFSVIGHIWVYKVLIAVVPFVVIPALSFVVYHLPSILNEIWRHNSASSCCVKFGWSLFVIVPGGLSLFIATAIGFLAVEILCFAFLAFGVFIFCTDRWSNNRQKMVNDKINAIIKFISTASICNRNKDRMLRILSVNVNIDMFVTSYRTYGLTPNSAQFIIKIDEEQGLKGLKEITYSDMRNNCGEDRFKRDANVFPGIWYAIKDAKPDKTDYMDCIRCSSDWRSNCEVFMYVVGYWLCLIGFPVFVCSKILQCVFPYLILGYLLYHKQLMSIDMFQLAMLFTYIGLQFVLLLLGITVCRVHWWLWHILPGQNWVSLNELDVTKFMNIIDKWYEERARIPFIRKYIIQVYGEDIAQIIMDYYQNINLA